jgi:hypothetical protein
MDEKFCNERFYELVLRLTNEWEVIGVRRDNEKQAVIIDVVLKDKDIVCPVCGKPARIHDHRVRRRRLWIHVKIKHILM